MERARRLDRADGVRARLRRQLRCLPDALIEQLHLIAAQLLHAQAAHRPLALRQHRGVRAVDETDTFRSLPGLVFKQLPRNSEQIGQQVVPHLHRLLERSAQHAHARAGLVKQIEQRRDRGQAGLASAARGPDDQVARRLKVGAAEVLEGRIVGRTCCDARHVQPTEQPHPCVQLIRGAARAGYKFMAHKTPRSPLQQTGAF